MLGGNGRAARVVTACRGAPVDAGARAAPGRAARTKGIFVAAAAAAAAAAEGDGRMG